MNIASLNQTLAEVVVCSVVSLHALKYPPLPPAL